MNASLRIGVIISSVPDIERAYIPALTLAAIIVAVDEVAGRNKVNIIGNVDQFNLTSLPPISSYISNSKSEPHNVYNEKLRSEGIIWKKDWSNNYHRNAIRKKLVDEFFRDELNCITPRIRKQNSYSSFNEARLLHKIEREINILSPNRLSNISNIELIVNDTIFNDAIGSLCAYDQYILGVDLILGGLNPFTIAPIARFASFVGIPYITPYGGVDFLTKNKKKYFRTLTRTSTEYCLIASAVLAVLRHFNWKRGSLVYQRTKDKTSAIYYIASAFSMTLNEDSTLDFKTKNYYDDVLENLANEIDIDSRGPLILELSTKL